MRRTLPALTLALGLGVVVGWSASAARADALLTPIRTEPGVGDVNRMSGEPQGLDPLRLDRLAQSAVGEADSVAVPALSRAVVEPVADSLATFRPLRTPLIGQSASYETTLASRPRGLAPRSSALAMHESLGPDPLPAPEGHIPLAEPGSVLLVMTGLVTTGVGLAARRKIRRGQSIGLSFEPA